MKKPEVSLILPCFNEAEHFSQSVSRILYVLNKLRCSYEVIFVEDKSTDDTRRLIQNYLKKHNKSYLHVIYHLENKGRGESVSDGIKKARGSIVGFIDIDLEVSEKYISSFVREINQGYDVVCGVRNYEFSLVKITRWFASNIYSFLVRIVLQIPLQDTESGYKFFRRSKVLPLLKKTRSYHWFWDTEIMTLSHYSNLKIKEIPVLFKRRIDKTSTVNLISDTIDYLKNLMNFRNRLKEEGYI